MMKQDFDKRQGRVTNMTRTYILALAMLVTFITGAFFSFHVAKNEHQAAMHLLTSTGSLRAETQRAVLLSNQLTQSQCRGIEESTCRARLEESLQSIRNLFDTIKSGGGHDEFSLAENRSLMTAFLLGSPDLAARLDQFINTLQLILRNPAPSFLEDDLRVLELNRQATGRLMADLDRLIATHREQVEERFDTFSLFHSIFFIATLILLTGQATLIFLPLFRRVTSQLKELTIASEELRDHNRKLEDAVTERTEELEAARQEAVNANHSKSRFLAQAGHDMLQPIEAMSMLIQLMTREIQSLRGKRLHSDIGATLSSMTRLVRAVLDISKLEAGVIVPRKSKIFLDDFFPTIVDGFRYTAHEKGLQLHVLKTGISIYSDPDLLERILRNLISNAIRYTDQGTVLIGVRRRNIAPEIWVCDTGHGIAAEDFETIFEEFKQLEDANRDRSEGIGLGLSIVSRLCRLLGHTVSLSSRPGHGTIFKISGLEKVEPSSNRDLAA